MVVITIKKMYMYVLFTSRELCDFMLTIHAVLLCNYLVFFGIVLLQLTIGCKYIFAY